MQSERRFTINVKQMQKSFDLNIDNKQHHEFNVESRDSWKIKMKKCDHSTALILENLGKKH